MSEGTSWLCPTELDRTRVVDANDRVRMIRLVGSGAVGAALLIAAPWIGWWTLGLFALSALNFLNVDRRLRTSRHPERVSATAIVITLVLLGGGVVHQRRSEQPRAALAGAARSDGRRALSPPGRGRRDRAHGVSDSGRHARRRPGRRRSKTRSRSSRRSRCSRASSRSSGHCRQPSCTIATRRSSTR